MGEISRFARVGLGPGAALLTTGAGLVVTATAAQARPTRCSYYARSKRTPQYAAAICPAGQFRAVGVCRHQAPSYTRYGAWLPASPIHLSRPYCGSGDSIHSAGLETRN